MSFTGKYVQGYSKTSSETYKSPIYTNASDISWATHQLKMTNDGYCPAVRTTEQWSGGDIKYTHCGWNGCDITMWDMGGIIVELSEPQAVTYKAYFETKEGHRDNWMSHNFFYFMYDSTVCNTSDSNFSYTYRSGGAAYGNSGTHYHWSDNDAGLIYKFNFTYTTPTLSAGKHFMCVPVFASQNSWGDTDPSQWGITVIKTTYNMEGTPIYHADDVSKRTGICAYNASEGATYNLLTYAPASVTCTMPWTNGGASYSNMMSASGSTEKPYMRTHTL